MYEARCWPFWLNLLLQDFFFFQVLDVFFTFWICECGILYSGFTYGFAFSTRLILTGCLSTYLACRQIVLYRDLEGLASHKIPYLSSYSLLWCSCLYGLSRPPLIGDHPPMHIPYLKLRGWHSWCPLVCRASKILWVSSLLQVHPSGRSDSRSKALYRCLDKFPTPRIYCILLLYQRLSLSRLKERFLLIWGKETEWISNSLSVVMNPDYIDHNAGFPW